MSELKARPQRKRCWASHENGRILCSPECKPALLQEMKSRRAVRPRWTEKQWKEEVREIRALGCWGVGEWGGLRTQTADGESCKAQASAGNNLATTSASQPSASKCSGGAAGFAAFAGANPIQAIGLPAPTGMASGSNMWSALSLARQQPLSSSQCVALLDDQYSIDHGVEAVLGQGAFGVVRPGVDRKSGDRVAAKFVEGPFREIVQEVLILGNLRHRNVIQILDAYKLDRGAVFIMRHAGQTLSSRIGGGLSVQTVACHLRQIALGLSWTHSQLIIHADLKPENILVDAEEEAVIGDFGNAVIIGDRTRLGATKETLRRRGVQEVTVCYRAPEVCLGENAFGPEIDIWSLGCIFSEMIIGRRTFEGCHEIGVFVKILMKLGYPRDMAVLQYYRGLVNWQVSFPSPSASQWTAEASLIPASSGGLLLLQRMLTWGPKLRICGADIASHPFCQAWGAKQTPMQLVVIDGVSDFQGNFGPYCIRKAVKPKELLAWSRESRCFQQPARRSYPQGEHVEPVVEEVGLLTGHETLRLNGRNVNELLFDKLIAFRDALLEANASSFSKLEQRLEAALQEIPPEDLGINGSKLLERKMTKWLWPFGTLQFAPNYPHECPKHNDGGLALIILAVGYYGWRVLRCFREDAEPFDLELEPGSVYIAPVSAFEHQVIHRGAPANSAGPPDLLHVPGLGLCKVTAIIRCRTFQEQWSTLKGRKPAPAAVFDVANKVVKEWLTHEPLRLPNLAECERALQAIL